MLDCFITEADQAVCLIPVTPDTLKTWLEKASPEQKNWVERNDFTAEADSFCMLPDVEGEPPRCLYGIRDKMDVWSLAGAPTVLPSGDYQLDDSIAEKDLTDFHLGWGIGSYAFKRYKKAEDKSSARLVANRVEPSVVYKTLAVHRARDLINTPAEDMMPQHLSAETQALAKQYQANFAEVVGDDLLKDNFPAIHAVGRASVHVPRLLKLEWGQSDHPGVALVGKGVCFDSGGLDIKPSGGMRLMQKDMGGAAQVLGLAEMIMAAKLPVRLQLLIPAVENAISSNAFHPGDIITMRNGKTVEVDNTDAEGRLVLADAMVLAAESKPELLIDFATLTGAARVAVGTEIGAMFSNNPGHATEIMLHSEAAADALWQLPIHEAYRSHLKSNFADMLNCATSGFGGAITAALFLKEYVADDLDWLHFDIMAWNQRKRPGRPIGGEAMGIRALFDWLECRYG